jgi:hypothetical protein
MSLDLGSEAALSIQAVTLKRPISERVAVSTLSRSTHEDGPNKERTVSRFQAIGGIPTISMCARYQNVLRVA